MVSIKINALETLNQDKLLLKNCCWICGHVCHGNPERKGFQEKYSQLCQMPQEWKNKEYGKTWICQLRSHC